VLALALDHRAEVEALDPRGPDLVAARRDPRRALDGIGPSGLGPGIPLAPSIWPGSAVEPCGPGSGPRCPRWPSTLPGHAGPAQRLLSMPCCSFTNRGTRSATANSGRVPISIVAKWAGHADAAFTLSRYVTASTDDYGAALDGIFAVEVEQEVVPGAPFLRQ